jgi:Uma2 family endonuclease
MVAPPLIQRMTVEEFERITAPLENADRSFELIDGEMVEKMPTEEHGSIIGSLIAQLVFFVKQHKLGIVTTDARHRIAEDKHNSYRPDISYISYARKGEIVRKGAVPLMPDLAVEVKSPDDSAVLMRKKAAYYIENGSKLVWLIFPNKRTVEVYTGEGDLEILDESGMLSGGEVLPGFTMAIKDVFEV